MKQIRTFEFTVRGSKESCNQFFHQIQQYYGVKTREIGGLNTASANKMRERVRRESETST